MKNKKNNRVLNITIIFVVLLSILVLGINLFKEKNYKNYKPTLQKINVIGTYSIEGKEGSFALPEDNTLNLSGYNNIIIEGSFDKEIPINTKLLMRIDNMRVKIFINGEEYYSFGQEDTVVEYAKSAGNLWTAVVSPGIKQSDKIRFELSNVYTDHVSTTFSSFLGNLYNGYESTLILETLKQKLLNSFIAIFILCIGIISVGLAFIMMIVKRPISKLMYFGGLCISSGIWCFLDFNLQNYLFPYPIFNNSIDIVSLLFSMFFLVAYFALFLRGRSKDILFSLAGTFLVAIIVTSTFQFLGIKDYYEWLFYIQCACIIYTPISLCCIFYERYKLNNIEIKKLLGSTIILAIGIMGDAICNMFELIPYMVWFKVSYLIFIIIQFVHITQIIRKSILESAKVQVLQQLAFQDGLTGVGNRTAYLKKVESLTRRLKKGTYINLWVFDINDLKMVNDTFGHEYGDQLIKRGASILTEVFDQDTIYRIGGDEFVVVLEDTNESNYYDLIKEFEREVINNNKCFIDQKPISMAYGIAFYDHINDMTFEEIFSRADKDMYDRKVKMKK